MGEVKKEIKTKKRGTKPRFFVAKVLTKLGTVKQRGIWQKRKGYLGTVLALSKTMGERPNPRTRNPSQRVKNRLGRVSNSPTIFGITNSPSKWELSNGFKKSFGSPFVKN